MTKKGVRIFDEETFDKQIFDEFMKEQSGNNSEMGVVVFPDKSKGIIIVTEHDNAVPIRLIKMPPELESPYDVTIVINGWMGHYLSLNAVSDEVDVHKRAAASLIIWMLPAVIEHLREGKHIDAFEPFDL